MEITTLSTEETKNLAKQVAEKLNSGDILILEGDLGAGKTTFVRYLTEALGFTDRVQSPTFVLARQYCKSKTNSLIKNINHLDLYRLTSPKELPDIGLKEYFNQPGSITVIEWPNIASDILPANVIKIKIDVLGENERKFNVYNLR